jgi:membrane-bound serine protease (ClpP class)
MIGNDGFNFELVPSENITRALMIVIISFGASLIVSIFLGRGLLKTKQFGKLVLQDRMNAGEGYVSSDLSLNSLVGATGITQSYLRPSGKVVIDDMSYSANAEFGFIESGREVIVTRFDGMILWVKIK